MKIEGTKRIADGVRRAAERAGRDGPVLHVTGAELKDVGTTPEAVMRNLIAGNGQWDLTHDSDSDVFTFHRGCAHSCVTETYARVGENRYTVVTTCDDCHAEVGRVSRVGGESARMKRITRPTFYPRRWERDGQPPKGGRPDEGREGAQDGAGSPPTTEEGQDKGEDARDDPAGTEGDCKRPSKATMDAFGGGEGGGEGEGGDGEGECECDPDKAYILAFKRHFTTLVAAHGPERQRAVYTRVTFLHEEEEETPVF